MKKKIISLFLAIVMVCSLLPATVFAAGTGDGMSKVNAWDVSAAGDGSVYAWLEENTPATDQVTYTLHIAGTGAMKDFANAAVRPYSDYAAKITAVVMGDGVTTVGDRAFRDLANLASVDLSDGLVDIGNQAFNGVTALESIEIPAGVTRMGGFTNPAYTDGGGNNPFSGCSRLQSITVATGNTVFDAVDGVLYKNNYNYSGERILYAYPQGLTATTFTVPVGVTAIGSNAFGANTCITSITFPSANNIDFFALAFSGCSSLVTVDASNVSTLCGNTTSCESVFDSCKVLQDLRLQKWDTSKVYNTCYMFSGCAQLQSLDLTGFDTSNLIETYNMFYNCKALQTLDLSNYGIGKATSMRDLFRLCSELNTLDLSSFNTSNVTLMHETFMECTQLTSLIFGSGFDTGNVTNMNMMFMACKSLQNLDISNFDTRNVNDMGLMFGQNNALKSLTIGPKFSTKNAQNATNFYTVKDVAKKNLESLTVKYDDNNKTVIALNTDPAMTATQADGIKFTENDVASVTVKNGEKETVITVPGTATDKYITVQEGVVTLPAGTYTIDSQSITTTAPTLLSEESDIAFVNDCTNADVPTDYTDKSGGDVTTAEAMQADMKARLQEQSGKTFTGVSLKEVTTVGTGAVNVTMDYPAGADDNSNFCLIHRMDNGVFEFPAVTKNTANNTVSFTLNGASPILLGYYNYEGNSTFTVNADKTSVHPGETVNISFTFDEGTLAQDMDFATVVFTYDAGKWTVGELPTGVTSGNGKLIINKQFTVIGTLDGMTIPFTAKTVSETVSTDFAAESAKFSASASEMASAIDAAVHGASVEIVPQYTVTFFTAKGTAPAAATVDYDAFVAEPTAPTADGYTLDGWYKEPACTNKWNFASDKVTENRTLYAKWTLNHYSVTFDAGAGTKANIADYTIENTTVLGAPTYPGHAFLNWKVKTQDGNWGEIGTTYADTKTVTGMYGNVELEAVYKANVYQVSGVIAEGTGTAAVPKIIGAASAREDEAYNGTLSPVNALYTYTVTATNDFDPTKTVTVTATGGCFTLTSEQIRALGADFTLSVSSDIGATVEVYDTFVNTIAEVVLTVDAGSDCGKYTFDGNPMYKIGEHQYAYLVQQQTGTEDSPVYPYGADGIDVDEATAKVLVGTETCEDVYANPPCDGRYDVTANGALDNADASQTQGCFSQVRDYITYMALYLRADVDGSHKIDAADVNGVMVEIVNALLG